jgi:hypothetical protein
LDTLDDAAPPTDTMVLCRMRTVAAVALLALACSCNFAVVVQALPTGAPNCETKEAAPDGFHKMQWPGRSRRTGSIAQYGLDLFVDGTLVRPLTTTKFTANETHAIRVVPRNPKQRPYRGVFLLVHHNDNLDMSTALTPLDPFQTAPGCRGTKIGGVTHRNNLWKNSTEPIALLRWDGVGTTDIRLNVNVVIDNNWTDSIFYYTQFTLESIVANPDIVPTASPLPNFSESSNPTLSPPTKRCGMLHMGVFCPLEACGWAGRLLGMCRD